MNTKSLVRAAGFIMSGAALGEGIVLLATPLLARIYAPDDFGKLAVFVALLGIARVTACLRYDYAIGAVPDNDVGPIVRAAYEAVLITTVLVAFIWLLSTITDSAFLNAYSSALALLAFGNAAVGAHQIGLFLSTRTGRFRLNGALRVVQPVFFVAFALFVAYSELQFDLTISYVAAFAILAIVCVGIIRNAVPTQSDALGAAIRHRQYPLLSLPGAILDAASLAAPVLLVSFNYGEAAAGNFAQAQRLLGAPLLLASMAAAQVFYKHSGDIFRSGGNTNKVVVRYSASLLGLGILLLIVVWLGGDELLRILLGDQWRTDSRYALLVVLPLVAQAAVSPISTIFLTTNTIKLHATWQLAKFLVSWLLLPVVASAYPIDAFLVALAAAYFLLYGIYFLFAMMVSRANTRTLLH